jgi:hypothetical protein
MKAIGAIVMILSLAGCGTAPPETRASDLALVKIKTESYSLGFGGKTNITAGTEIDGFVVLSFTPKFQKRTLPDGKEVTVDISELRLKRDDKTITLVKNQRMDYNEYIVHLVDKSDGKNYLVRTEQEITIGSRRMRLRETNVKESSCTLEDLKSGELFTIKRMAQPEN